MNAKANAYGSRGAAIAAGTNFCAAPQFGSLTPSQNVCTPSTGAVARPRKRFDRGKAGNSMPGTLSSSNSRQPTTLLSPRGVPESSKYYSLFFRVINQQGRISPRQAIKAQCLDCQGLDRQAVADCGTRRCPLWHFRPYQTDMCRK
jgi:hypothetical protein